MLSNLYKAVDRPGDAIYHASNLSAKYRQRLKLELARRKKSIALQQSFVDEFVNQDEFILIILDACRFDIFRDVHDSFLVGDLQNIWASGRWTGEYTQRTWTNQYRLTYLTSIPVISDFYFELRESDYRPSGHFEQLVPLWDSEWDPSLGTVPAEKVTDSALRHASQSDTTRLVVHYAQPHAPYVGETQILPWDEKSEDMRELLENDMDTATERIYDQIKNGDISKTRLKEAYVANLEYVLQEVVRLVNRVDCPVVVTGDHGEHLGEDGRYLHEEDSVLIRQVPWFVVNDSEIGHTEIEPRYKEEQIGAMTHSSPSGEVKNRLADLGYTDQ